MDEKNRLAKLRIIPYRQGIAEYAAQVRKEVQDMKDTDFILAVDLPRGLESEVMAAAKKLPGASVIVDQLFRGIPIIPTSAPVEAVRSFQETGADLKFIDTSLPVTGNMDDYRYFIDQCRLSGVATVIKNAEYYGISPDDLMKSWLDTLERSDSQDGFRHLPEIAAERCAAPFSEDRVSPYRKTRLQSMALKLNELLDTGTDVILVCSLHHISGILHYLSKLPDPVDDSYIVPARTCAVGEADMQKLSPEVPYFMYLYELFRDTPVDREKWILDTCCGTDADTLSPEKLRMVQSYAYKLALTNKELYPDIYNLVVSAKYCVTDEYAYELYNLLKSYPPAGRTPSECSFHNILDYNFLPLGSMRYLKLQVSVFNESPSIQRLRRKLLRGGGSFGYSRFTRTPLSYKNECDFMKYMTGRFRAPQTSANDCQAHEFVSGFCEGPDIRETIRNMPSGRVYVREPEVENRACYVMDYRTTPVGGTGTPSRDMRKTAPVQESLDTSTRFCSAAIFLDRNYPWVGLASSTGMHYVCGVMVALAGVRRDPIPLMGEFSYSRPLESAVDIGVRYAKKVFVFTDLPEEIKGKYQGNKDIRILPTSAVPPHMFKKMQEFDIICNRYDNRRGD